MFTYLEIKLGKCHLLAPPRDGLALYRLAEDAGRVVLVKLLLCQVVSSQLFYHRQIASEVANKGRRSLFANVSCRPSR